MIRTILLQALAAIALAAGASAQIGSWGTPSLHDESVGPGFVNPLTPSSSGALFNAVHLALIPQPTTREGLVLAWDRQDQVGTPAGWAQRWTVLDPSTNPPTVLWNDELMIAGRTSGDLFCSGHAWTPDGRLFVAGGTSAYSHGTLFGGAKLAFLYDPRPTTAAPYGTWTRLPDMAEDRWYPTVTTMADGKLMVSGGSHYDVKVNSYEVYDLTTQAWQTDAVSGNAWFPGPLGAASYSFSFYPRLHSLADGRLFMSGPKIYAGRLDHPAAPGVWDMTSTSSSDRHDGSSFLYPLGFGSPDATVILGGSNIATGHTTAHQTVEWCLPQSPSASWTPGPSLAKPRVHLNTVVLPDATVLAIGGNAMVAGQMTYWRDAEWLDSSLTWKSMPDGASDRDYHSTAVLLPDGRVLSAGGDHRNFDWQRLVPPTYDDPAKPRPTGVTLPTTELEYWQVSQQLYTADFSLPPGRSISKVVLMVPGSVTHHSDFGQRYIELPILAQADGSVTFAPPYSAPNPAAPLNFTAPRGYAMLFLISDQGIPSEGRFVRL